MSREPVAKVELLDVAAHDVHQHTSILASIRNGHRPGLIIRNAFAVDAMEAVVDRLPSEVAKLGQFYFPNAERSPRPYTLGSSLIGNPPDSRDYFARAPGFRSACRRLFAGFPDFEERLETILGELGGAVPVTVAPGPEPDTTYTPATIRVLPPSHEIPLHVGNYFLSMPHSRHLSTLLDTHTQLSYFVTLSAPDAGGELIIYSLQFGDTAAAVSHRSSGYGASEDLSEIDTVPSVAVTPRTGDLLVFDGGRYYHRVAPVSGVGIRRTIGGFAGFTKDLQAILYWS